MDLSYERIASTLAALNAGATHHADSDQGSEDCNLVVGREVAASRMPESAESTQTEVQRDEPATGSDDAPVEQVAAVGREGGQDQPHGTWRPVQSRAAHCLREHPGWLARHGVGLGLRFQFLGEVAQGPTLPVSCLEISPENYLWRGGWHAEALAQVAARYPINTHGLSMSIGSMAPPDESYLVALGDFLERLQCQWHSDHLCFGRAGGRMLHDLLPLKRTKENAQRVGERLRCIQDRLGMPLAVENITWDAPLGRPEMSEAEFIREVLDHGDGLLLLDVNNVWVNAMNHNFDPHTFITQLPLDRVVELHVAGHNTADDGDVRDTHGEPVIDPVMELLEFTLERTGPLPVVLERDRNIPPLAKLVEEVDALWAVYRRAVYNPTLYNPSGGTLSASHGNEEDKFASGA